MPKRQIGGPRTAAQRAALKKAQAASALKRSRAAVRAKNLGKKASNAERRGGNTLSKLSLKRSEKAGHPVRYESIDVLKKMGYRKEAFKAKRASKNAVAIRSAQFQAQQEAAGLHPMKTFAGVPMGVPRTKAQRKKDRARQARWNKKTYG